MNFQTPTYLCTCSHRKARHWHTKQNPNGPCLDCPCPSLTPEDICECNHGKKAHAKGYCHECHCKVFRKKAA